MRRAFAFSLALCACLPLIAQSSAATDNERLSAVAKLWVTVKYFHPYLAYKNVDWDGALVRALPAIRKAGKSADYAAALNGMLRELGDPGTYAGLDSRAAADAHGTLTDANARSELMRNLQSAESVVLDLRAGGQQLSRLLDDPLVARVLVSGQVDLPGQRTWIHEGLTPAIASVPSAYHSSFLTNAGAHIAGTYKGKRSIKFLLSEGASLPAIGCALIAMGNASVEGVFSHYQACTVTPSVISMGSGVTVRISLSEPAFSDGTGFALPVTHKPLPPFPVAQAEPAYPDAPYPSAEYRILAAYKIWGVFHYFYAYRDQMDEDWDQIFEAYLPKLEGAKDAREYHLLIAEWIARAADSQAQVQSAELTGYFGAAPLGIKLRLIDKKPVVTAVLDPNAQKAGIAPGDIATEIDGENMAKRINREALYVSASTQQSLGHLVMERVLNGPEGSSAAVTFAGRNGAVKTLSLVRSSSYRQPLGVKQGGEAYRLLPGNIGYVDLTRLLPAQVDPMFEALGLASAIVFDSRGPANGTGQMIASGLTDKQNVPAAIVNRPLVAAPDLPAGDTMSQVANYLFVQTISHGNKPAYKGKTVMLIDESTAGEAEHDGLLFEAANKTEFIGLPSAGADGNVSNFVVPGGVTISFSGDDVRHANGGPLQRLGLQPNLTVDITAGGIRMGRDEILDKALEYLKGTVGDKPALHRSVEKRVALN